MGKAFGLVFFVLFSLTNFSFGGPDNKPAEHANAKHGGEDFDPGATAFHHIADANVYSIGPLQIPLPAILYAKDEGRWDVFMSSKFDFDRAGHGDGHKSYNGYVLKGGAIKRLAKPGEFAKGAFEVDGFTSKEVEHHGKKHMADHVIIEGQELELKDSSKADGGLFGGGITNFFDFSITKNVVAMILVMVFLSWLFLSVAQAYKNRKNQAPKGLQNFMEPIFIFIQDEVAKPFLGKKWEKYLPFLLSLFFFILGLNLFGQIPFFGNANVTGALSVTMVLALFTFLVTNLSGNAHYWKHVFWMPGTPAWIKIILTPVEILGVLIKPLTLMLRLFANITAGHMVLVIFVGLIFVFGKSGQSVGGSLGTAVGSMFLTMFMMAIELIVAFIQAFVFTILSASYIGAAIEEHH